MRKILICLLFYTNFVYSLEYSQVNCGTFDEYTSNLKSDSKLYYRGHWNWNNSAVDKKTSKDEFIESISSFKYHDMYLGSFDLNFNHTLAMEENFPIAYDKITVDKRAGENIIVKRSYIPKVIVKTKHGYVTAIDKGEWGGELLFVKFNNEITFIKDIAVEDMFPYENGFVVIAGSNHMVSTGSVYFLDFEQDQFKFTKLFGLIDAPRSSWKLPDGRIVINSKSGTQILSKGSVLTRVECTKNDS